ncbi:MAG TPA: hypothetical protein VEY08_16745, partial [Chloroflexia bacterium]|nr:hypothetical protein [Chloroflexia bacterium]
MRLKRLLIASIVGLFMVAANLALQPVLMVSGAPVLTISPASWGVVGLDSNNVTAGPNVFSIGARVCNTGDAPATNVVSSFVWDSANQYVNLQPGTNGTMSLPSLAPNQCTLFLYSVQVTRTALAFDTSRAYHITAAATGVSTVSTPLQREIYVERILSQGRNSIAAVQGPSTVVIG